MFASSEKLEKLDKIHTKTTKISKILLKKQFLLANLELLCYSKFRKFYVCGLLYISSCLLAQLYSKHCSIINL